MKVVILDTELNKLKEYIVSQSINVVDEFLTSDFKLKTEERVKFNPKSFPLDVYEQLFTENTPDVINVSLIDSDFYLNLSKYILSKPFKSIIQLNDIIYRLKNEEGKIVQYSVANPFSVKCDDDNVYQYIDENEENEEK